MSSRSSLILAVLILALSACSHPLVQRRVGMVVTSDGLASSGGTGACVDKDGNLIIAGVFQDQFVLGGQKFESQGRHDIFIAKFDPKQQLLWVESFGGPGNDFAPAVAVDPSGTITLCCDFEYMLNLTARFALYCDGHGQAILRLSADGAGLDVVQVQAKGGKHEVQINDLCMGSDGETRAVGNFSADTLFVSSFDLSGNATGDAFLTAQGSATLFMVTRGADRSNIGLRAFAENGEVYGLNNRIRWAVDGGTLLAGTYTNGVHFGANDIPGQGAYVAKLDAKGAVEAAQRVPFTTSDPSSFSLDGLCVTGADRVLVAFGFKGSLREQGGDQVWTSGKGKDELFTVMDMHGKLDASRQFGNDDDVFVKALVPDGEFVTAVGYYHGLLQVDGTSQLPADGKFNGFLLGLDDDLTTRSLDRTSGKGQQFLMGAGSGAGSIGIAGTYFGESVIGPVVLPKVANRFFGARIDRAN